MSARQKYTLYMFRQVSMSASGALYKSPFTTINVTRAFKQHEKFITKVQRAAKVGNGVVGSIVFPGSSEHPECAFMADCVVSLAPGVAVITNPLETPRRGETGLFSRFFHTRSMQGENMNIYEMVNDQYCSGGDVLRIDNTVFVAQSEQTNFKSHSRWRDICELHGLQYHRIFAPRLKSLVSWLGPDIGLVGVDTKSCHSVVHQIMQAPSMKKYGHGEKIHIVDSVKDTDLLRVNNTIFHRAGTNINHLKEKNEKITFVPIDIDELAKIGGLLTSLCVPLEQ